MTFAYRMQENGAPATKEKLCILCEGSSDALFIALEREALQPHPESEWDKSTRDPDSRPVMETFKAHHIWTWGFTTSILVSLGNFHRTKRCNISTLWITNVCSESYCKNRCKPSSAKQMQQKEKPLLIVLRLWNCKELQVFCIILDWGNFKGAISSLLDSRKNKCCYAQTWWYRHICDRKWCHTPSVCCSPAPCFLAAQSCRCMWISEDEAL